MNTMDTIKDLFDNNFIFTNDNNDVILLCDLRDTYIRINGSDFNYKLFLKYLNSVGVIKYVDRVYKLKIIEHVDTVVEQPNTTYILNINNIYIKDEQDTSFAYKIEKIAKQNQDTDSNNIINISSIINECENINKSINNINNQLQKDNNCQDLKFNIHIILDQLEIIKQYAESKYEMIHSI